MPARSQFSLLLILLASFGYATAQTLPNQTFSITNSSDTRVTFQLNTSKRQWTETIEPYFTRQYTTSESYRITLSTAKKPAVQFNLSPPNKYSIQWEAKRGQWVIVTSGRFY